MTIIEKSYNTESIVRSIEREKERGHSAGWIGTDLHVICSNTVHTLSYPSYEQKNSEFFNFWQLILKPKYMKITCFFFLFIIACCSSWEWGQYTGAKEAAGQEGLVWTDHSGKLVN